MNVDFAGSRHGNANNRAFKRSLNAEIKNRYEFLIPLSRQIILMIGNNFLDFNSQKENIENGLNSYSTELVKLDLWLGNRSLQLIDKREMIKRLMFVRKKRDIFHNHIKEVQVIKMLVPITKE